MNNPARCSFFIDGFNFYHSIDNSPLNDRYKWINYASLARAYLPPGNELQDVYYFTAFANWLPEKAKRHRALVRALVSEGVKIVRGKFKWKMRHCNKCAAQWKAHEEKQTDINIALELLALAITDEYDTAVLVSGDTDLVPAVRKVKSLKPGKRVGVLFPPGMRHKELASVCDFELKLYPNQLKKFRFADTVQVISRLGTTTVHCPPQYR